MRDLESHLLTAKVVSTLTGLSARTLRLWDAYGPLPKGKAGLRGRTGTRRLFSWREVEQLQRAAYLVETRHVSFAEAMRLLTVSGSVKRGRRWIIARARPRKRKWGWDPVAVGRLLRSASRRAR
jgi:hypothetical protein